MSTTTNAPAIETVEELSRLLQQALMNLPRAADYADLPMHERGAYKIGHRDARHAAVEVAIALLAHFRPAPAPAAATGAEALTILATMLDQVEGDPLAVQFFPEGLLKRARNAVRPAMPAPPPAAPGRIEAAVSSTNQST